MCGRVCLEKHELFAIAKQVSPSNSDHLVGERSSGMVNRPLLTISRTPSFEYFEDDDPDFIDALLRAKLPGDLSESSQASSKRQDTTSENQSQAPAVIQESLKRQRSASSASNPTSQQPNDYEDVEVVSDDNGPSRLGHFRENMRKKRAKLQVGSAQSERADDGSSKIFSGIAIYVCVCPYTQGLFNQQHFCP
jgi:hypothetical protein